MCWVLHELEWDPRIHCTFSMSQHLSCIHCCRSAECVFSNFFSPLSAKVNSLPLHSSTCGEGTTPAISKEHRTSETTKNGAGHAACNNISVWASMGDYFILFLGIRHALTAWESWHVRIFKTAGQIHKTNITSPQSLNCGRHCWIDFNLVS